MLKPIMDRILLRRLEEKKSGPIHKPDAYSESNKYEVLAIGDLVILGGQRFDVSEFVNVGDVVLVPPYNIEDCELDGEKYLSCRVQDVRGKRQAVVNEIDLDCAGETVTVRGIRRDVAS